MVRPLLFIHWKQARLVLLPFVLASFGLPLLAVQGLGTPPGAPATGMDAYRLMAAYPLWTPFFPALAVGIGLVLALTAWNWDHRLEHVYALSLPLPRWRYALLKMGSGAVLSTLPALAFWAGAHAAAASIRLPATLHAYPNELTLRFLAAILLTYAGFFAAAAGTVRTTLWIVSGLVAFVVLGNVLSPLLVGAGFDVFERVSVVEMAFRTLVRLPGPFEIFTGNWLLIDV